MVQQQLIEYITAQLKQGSTPSQISSALLNAGYAQKDVEEALRAAGTKHVTTGVLIIAFISILVIIIGILLVLRATSQTPADLRATISLFTPKVAPGSDLVASVTIKNTGGSTTGLIDLSVRSGGNEIARITEKFSITDEKTVPITLRIPTEAKPGSAEVQADISWSNKKQSARTTFTISSETATETSLSTSPIETISEPTTVEKAREQQEKCPSNCDDLNFCTQDSCSQGRCVNTDIMPCCGNNACETGESDDSCAIDCAEEKPNLEEIGQTAITQAGTDFSSALRTCQSLGQQNYVNLCLSDIAGVGKNKQACAEISSADLRDGCYVQFAYNGDSEACTHIENPSMQTSCEQLIQLAKMQAEYGSG